MLLRRVLKFNFTPSLSYTLIPWSVLWSCVLSEPFRLNSLESSLSLQIARIRISFSYVLVECAMDNRVYMASLIWVQNNAIWCNGWFESTRFVSGKMPRRMKLVIKVGNQNRVNIDHVQKKLVRWAIFSKSSSIFNEDNTNKSIFHNSECEYNGKGHSFGDLRSCKVHIMIHLVSCTNFKMLYEGKFILSLPTALNDHTTCLKIIGTYSRGSRIQN